MTFRAIILSVVFSLAAASLHAQGQASAGNTGAENVAPPPGRILLDAPGHVCVEGDRPIARGGVPGAKWSIADWRGRDTGVAGVFDGNGNTTLPPLPTGYYRIVANGSGGAGGLHAGVSKAPSLYRDGGDAIATAPSRDNGGDVAKSPQHELATFAVVPPPESRVMDRASFYGVDSAQSGISKKGKFLCPWNNGDTFRTVSDLIALAGVPHVRDRDRWADVNPEPDVFAFGGSVPKYNAELLRERGILVSGLFCAAPAWAEKIHKLPANLNEVFSACARVAGEFGDCMGDWEFWNEPDIGNEPVWDYAAVLKAAYLGFKSGRPGMTVLPAALCRQTIHDIDLRFYARVLYENDAAKFGDVFNFHTYNGIASYPKMMATLREFMAGQGIADQAVWMTENGTHLEGRASRQSTFPGFMAHAPEQELVKAECYPKVQIALQMEGVARSYYFVFGAYNEYGGTKDWGVMRRDGTVKPEYAAISTMMRELVAARLDGELDVREGCRAYLFSQPDNTQTVAFWSVSPLETQKDGAVAPTPDFAKPLLLPAPDGTYRLSDLCGMCTSVTATNGVLPLVSTRFPSYVAGLHGLAATKAPHPAGKVRPYVPSPDEDLSVIVQVSLDADDFEIAAQKTRAVVKGDVGHLKMRIWNMDDVAKEGYLEVDGAEIDGLPSGGIVLGPRGSAPAMFDCTLAPAGNGEDFTQLVVTGVFGGKRSSRFVMPLCFERQMLAGCKISPLSWQNPNDWELTTSASSFKAEWDAAEQALRFDMAWNDSNADHCFQAAYRLNLPQEGLAFAQQIGFEVKAAQDKVENDFNEQILYLDYGDSERPLRRISFPAPVGGWEKRLVKLNEEFDLPNVKALRIGVEPKGGCCALWLRNVNVIKSGE